MLFLELFSDSAYIEPFLHDHFYQVSYAFIDRDYRIINKGSIPINSLN